LDSGGQECWGECTRREAHGIGAVWGCVGVGQGHNHRQLHPQTVSFFFAKADLNEPNRLRTRLEIRFPSEKFLSLFWKTSREFRTSLEKVKPWPGEEEARAGANPEGWPAVQDRSESANFDYIARSGSEVIFDFFCLSPAGVARLAQGLGAQGLRIDPVVRVQTNLAELRCLMAQAEQLVEKLRTLVPKDLLNDDDD
jgi:hypothetical protein